MPCSEEVEVLDAEELSAFSTPRSVGATVLCFSSYSKSYSASDVSFDSPSAFSFGFDSTPSRLFARRANV